MIPSIYIMVPHRYYVKLINIKFKNVNRGIVFSKCQVKYRVDLIRLFSRF